LKKCLETELEIGAERRRNSRLETGKWKIEETVRRCFSGRKNL